ncbi:MAG: hypothetical protein U9P38_08535, partial [Campylobacterota bacterium]|nr:hypothetical protein [Campylobacterota bacterium]
KIDTALKDKPQKEIQMIYVMIFGAIFAFSYLLFWDSSLEKFMNKIDKISSITHKTNMDNIYLKLNPPTKIIKLNQTIKQYNDKTLLLKDNNDYIKHQIETIPSLIYDKKIWGEYLHSISTSAKIHNIKILEFHNKLAENKDSFGHILDISIKSTAEYLDTLKFIDSLEQSDLVVDIHHINIKAEDKLYTDLNISVWGITY